MTMLAQKHSSPAIQATPKQTEPSPGPAGPVSDPRQVRWTADVFLTRLIRSGAFEVRGGGEDSRRCC